MNLEEAKDKLSFIKTHKDYFISDSNTGELIAGLIDIAEFLLDEIKIVRKPTLEPPSGTSPYNLSNSSIKKLRGNTGDAI